VDSSQEQVKYPLVLPSISLMEDLKRSAVVQPPQQRASHPAPAGVALKIIGSAELSGEMRA